MSHVRGGGQGTRTLNPQAGAAFRMRLLAIRIPSGGRPHILTTGAIPGKASLRRRWEAATVMAHVPPPIGTAHRTIGMKGVSVGKVPR